jgi:tetratricopeptide (TPR) repeat protein
MRVWAAAALLAVAVMALYAPVASHEFLHWDDQLYVTDNPIVRQGLTWSGLRWAFEGFHVGNWHPLTWVSHMVDVELFGVEPGAHLLVNAFLHAVNTALLFTVLTRMTGAPGKCLVVAVLFAVHPLHVESVAWVSERKDLLSTLFGFLMLGAYARFAAAPGVLRYAAVVLAFAASLLAKPMWVTAPFLLLLLDMWPLRRAGVRRLVAEKLPLAAVAFSFSILALHAQQQGGAVASIDRVGAAARVSNALVSYVRYVGSTFWPAGLSAYYPWPQGGWPAWAIAGAAALLVVVTAVAIRLVREMPWVPVGWFWFVGMLVPVIGIVQVGAQAMADRYTYAPVVGLFMAITWTFDHVGRDVVRETRARRAALAAIGVIVVALAAVTIRDIGFWRDTETLFRRAVALSSDNARAHLILSQELEARRVLDDALVHARTAVVLDPSNSGAHKNFGYMLYRAGRIDEAIAELEFAIALNPEYAEAYGNLAIAYGRKGRIDAAARAMARERELKALQRDR